MLLTWIAEVADETLTPEPGDRRVEYETDTWWRVQGLFGR